MPSLPRATTVVGLTYGERTLGREAASGRDSATEKPQTASSLDQTTPEQSFAMSDSLAMHLLRLTPGQTFAFPLPDEPLAQWTVARTEPSPGGASTIIATDGNNAHAVISLVDANSVQARIIKGGEQWLYRSQAGSNTHHTSTVYQTVQGVRRDALVEAPAHRDTIAEPIAYGAGTLAHEPLIAQALARAEVLAIEARTAKAHDGARQLALLEGAPETPQAVAPANIDVAFVVAPSLQRLYGSIAARDADIAMIVAIANNAMATNGIDVRVRAVTVNPLSIELPNINQSALLANLRDGAGAFGEQWPNQLRAGADVVALLTPFRSRDSTDGNCGRGYVGTLRSGGTFSSGQLGFSVSARMNEVPMSSFCFPSTFAHELGHNLGNLHDRINAPSGTGAFSYSRGYTVPGAFRDIMGTGSANRLELYSDPNRTCQGQPCGKPESAIDSADAAKTIKSTGPLMAFGLDPRERFTGWYVVNGELGTGWAIEVQDTRMFVAYFAYEADGSATWYAGPGRECAPNKFCVDLNRYQGGATAAGPFKAPSNVTRVATATLTLIDGAQPTIALATGLRNQTLSRFNINETANAFNTRPSYPNRSKSGWYWDASQGGTGIFVETQGSTSFTGYFHYRSNGTPTWLAARSIRYTTTPDANGLVGSYASANNRFSSYEGGQTLTGPYKAPREVNTHAASGFLSTELDYISIAQGSELRTSSRFTPFRDF